MANNKRIIFQYIRKANRSPRGIVVATLCDDDKVRIGFALRKSSDRADREEGLRIATERAELGRRGPVIEGTNTAEMVEDAISDIARRARNYFKGKQVNTPSVRRPEAVQDIFEHID